MEPTPSTQTLAVKWGKIHPPTVLGAFPYRLGKSDSLGSGTFSYFITFQRGSHQHHRPHGGHHIIWGYVFRLQN